MTSESKTKMLSVRLSEEEYAHCRELCAANGISTVSELARAAISLLCHNFEQFSNFQLGERISKLEWRIQALSLEMFQLRHTTSRTVEPAAMKDKP